MGVHDLDGGIEVRVEHGDECVALQLFGKLGEAGEVKVTDHGLALFDRTAHDIARQNPLTGIAPQISFCDVFRHLPVAE